MTTTPSKADQKSEAEAAARATSGPADGVVPEPAGDDLADTLASHQPGDQGAEQEPLQRLVKMSPADEARANISKKFRRAGEDFDGDNNNEAMHYGTDPLPKGQPEQTYAEPEPRKIKLKVRHEEKELTEDEVIALAQKAAAGDSYLEDAKNILELAKAEREAVARPHQDGKHPVSQTEQETAGENDPPHQEDDFEALVDELQFGDKATAAQKLRDIVKNNTGSSTEAAEQAAVAILMNRDVNESKKQLESFRDANPDLHKDPKMVKFFEILTYDEVRKDLTGIGLAEDQLPKDQKQLAQLHRYYRVQGANVRTVQSIFQDAKKELTSTFPGSQTKSPEPRQARPGQTNVTVDRAERRASIPAQPMRTTAPAPASAQQGQQAMPYARANAIANMRRARGQTVA